MTPRIRYHTIPGYGLIAASSGEDKRDNVLYIKKQDYDNLEDLYIPCMKNLQQRHSHLMI
jgi:hypothetical protein